MARQNPKNADGEISQLIGALIEDVAKEDIPRKLLELACRLETALDSPAQATCSLPDDHIDPLRCAFSWQDRFCGTFGAGCGHAVSSSQPSDDDAEGAGGHSGLHGARISLGGALGHDRADGLQMAASGHGAGPQPHPAPASNHADARARGGGPAQDAAGVDRRPARGGARVPEPGGLTFGAGPLSAAAWGWQSA